MIRFTVLPEKPQDTTLVGLGLCEANLQRLTANEPIYVPGDSLELPGKGCDMLIYGAKDAGQFVERVNPLIEAYYHDQPDVNVPVINLHDGELLLMPLSHKERVGMLYVIGLIEKSMAILRNKGILKFRARYPAADQTPIEVLIFYGRRQEELEYEFINSGLITAKTKYTKQGERNYVLSVGHYRSKN
jgi:hypothetical protein